ncbi:MAG: amidohydrolase family protein, partial [Acidobacteria bacterium]|nr:amidohydrolase family protein [Acidobacteriota bacterium]
IRALLHVVSIGLVAGNTDNKGELLDLRYCDPNLAVKVATENRDLIVGFKMRFSDFLTGANDLEGIRRARTAADETGLPLMVHVGGPHSPFGELLKHLKKGDVVTHTFNPRQPGILDDSGKLRPEVLEAQARGVLFDVGHGAGSFAFEVMERALGQGFRPDTISTDLHAFNINGPVYDFPTTLSKFLQLGFTLPEVIAKSTDHPARAFNFGAKIGTLAPGAEADVAVFELREGEFTFTDVEKKTRTGHHMLVPVTTVRAGRVFSP